MNRLSVRLSVSRALELEALLFEQHLGHDVDFDDPDFESPQAEV